MAPPARRPSPPLLLPLAALALALLPALPRAQQDSGVTIEAAPGGDEFIEITAEQAAQIIGEDGSVTDGTVRPPPAATRPRLETVCRGVC